MAEARAAKNKNQKFINTLALKPEKQPTAIGEGQENQSPEKKAETESEKKQRERFERL